MKSWTQFWLFRNSCINTGYYIVTCTYTGCVSVTVTPLLQYYCSKGVTVALTHPVQKFLNEYFVYSGNSGSYSGILVWMQVTIYTNLHLYKNSWISKIIMILAFFINVWLIQEFLYKYRPLYSHLHLYKNYWIRFLLIEEFENATNSVHKFENLK